jgi:hypothetical protein
MGVCNLPSVPLALTAAASAVRNAVRDRFPCSGARPLTDHLDGLKLPVREM